MGRVVGFDVGARRLDGVALEEGRAVAATFGCLSEAVAWAGGAERAAVDGPDYISCAPHAKDASLPAKFRTARCGEVALGRELRIWVPWVPPTTFQALAGWMRASIELHRALREAGIPTIEVYPFACFRALQGPGKLPPKTAPAGRAVRGGLLAARGIFPPSWTHHVLDAAVAALTARDAAQGAALAISCGHDGSALWLPSPAVGAECTLDSVEGKKPSREGSWT